MIISSLDEILGRFLNRGKNDPAQIVRDLYVLHNWPCSSQNSLAHVKVLSDMLLSLFHDLVVIRTSEFWERHERVKSYSLPSVVATIVPGGDDDNAILHLFAIFS